MSKILLHRSSYGKGVRSCNSIVKKKDYMLQILCVIVKLRNRLLAYVTETRPPLFSLLQR